MPSASSPSPSRAKKSVSFSSSSAPNSASGQKRRQASPKSPTAGGRSRRSSPRSRSRAGSGESDGGPECIGCTSLKAASAEATARESGLRESNSRLQAEVTHLAAEVNRLLEWRHLTREKIRLNCPEFDENPDEEFDAPLDRLIEAALHPPAAEIRLVDLETRVTQLTIELSQCAGRALLYEGLLEELLANRCDPDETHEMISDAFLATGKVIRDAYDKDARRSPRPPASMSESAQLAILENKDPSALLDEFERKISLGPLAAYPDRGNLPTLLPPAHRLPGATPISQMNRDLRQLVCADLNLERRAGNDWRMLAARLGFADQVPAWSRLASPMAKLLAEWGHSETATVRLLHRHLSSPEMRSPLLAKRLQEFYRVD